MDKELELLSRYTESAYLETLNAMSRLVNCITQERNYYRKLCKQKEEDYE